MEIFRGIFSILILNFSRWKKDLRILIVLVFVALLVIHYLSGYISYAVSEHKSITFCLLPLLHLQSQVSLAAPKMIIYLCFVLLICDAPFMYPTTPYIVLRTKRNGWWLGECLYIILSALFFMLFLTACSVILSLPCISFKNDWGSAITDYLFGSEKYTFQELVQKYPISIDIPMQAVRYLNPFECQIYTFFTGWATMTFLGFSTYLGGLLKSRSALGIEIAVFFLLLDPIMALQSNAGRPWMLLLSPLCWTSVEQLSYTRADSPLTIPKVICGFVFVFLAQLIAIRKISKKVYIDVS